MKTLFILLIVFFIILFLYIAFGLFVVFIANRKLFSKRGEDPDNISDKHLSFTVTGTITGNTANTITLQTDDGAIDTFRVESAENYADQALEYGSYVRIIFHPSRSKSSNIYTAVQIHDA